MGLSGSENTYQVGGHDEIVLDNECGLLGVHDETLDDSRGNDTLLGVEISRWLVDEVDVGWDAETRRNQKQGLVYLRVVLTQEQWRLFAIHHQTGSELPGR